MRSWITIGIATATIGSAEAGKAPARDADPTPERGRATARAMMVNPVGHELGTLTLTETENGIEVSGRIGGLPPGPHAVHLYAVGKCDPPRFESAGGHWNPEGASGRARPAHGPHLGDLPTVTTGPDGATMIRATTSGGTLGGELALLDADGAAVIVHATGLHPDDRASAFSTNPRIACGVVKPA